RVEVGLGTGWLQEEHERYGFPFPPLGARMDELAEQLAIVRAQWGPDPLDHAGERYRLRDLDARPKPVQPRLPLLMGGEAKRRSPALAAGYPDGYNRVWTTPAQCAGPRQRLRAACDELGRDPDSLPLSVMTLAVVGRDRAEVDERLRRLARAGDGELGEG